MAEQPTRLFRDASEKIKSDVDELVEGLDLQSLGRRVQEFGSQSPWGMAVAALTVGFVAGMLMRGSSTSGTSAVASVLQKAKEGL